MVLASFFSFTSPSHYWKVYSGIEDYELKERITTLLRFPVMVKVIYPFLYPEINNTRPPARASPPRIGGIGMVCLRSADTCSGPRSMIFSWLVYVMPLYARAITPIT